MTAKYSDAALRRPECAQAAMEVPLSAASDVLLRSRKQCGENTVFRIYLDHIDNGAGLEVREYLSVVPKTIFGEAVTGVAVLPVVEGKIGLISVLRHPLQRRAWEVPKGMVERGEELVQSAVRELREETGYVASESELVDLGYTAPDPGLIVARIKLFSIALAGARAFAAEGELGHGELAFFTPREILRLIMTGMIEDACTLAILFRQSLTVDGGWSQQGEIA